MVFREAVTRDIEQIQLVRNSVKENVLMRKSLVGFQFGIAAITFIGAIIISQQINLFLNKLHSYI